MLLESKLRRIRLLNNNWINAKYHQMAFRSPSDGAPISPNQPSFGIPGQTKVSGDRQRETTHEICCLAAELHQFETILCTLVTQSQERLCIKKQSQFLHITEEDGRKLKNIYIEKNCSFSLNLMVKIGKTYFYGL